MGRWWGLLHSRLLQRRGPVPELARAPPGQAAAPRRCLCRLVAPPPWQPWRPPSHAPPSPPPPQAAVVAIANIYYGILHIYEELGAWAWACYTAVLAVIVGISVAKDTSDFLR